ncbi:transcription factor ICE1 [Prunus yedoensis var. nudiflora]|uniref:Transcription factor ICE1 n=1 Tax=Prunus yedoensis var. nudiflora TaxID=2094558 RepID=A0A315AV19_PRUYE|nr:transcription factor ICE1 [Prunus yedoensis var. nudiflora]
MLPRLNGAVWMGDREDRDSASWNRTTAATTNNSNCGVVESKDELGSLSTFKSMLDVDDDWYLPNNSIQSHSDVRDIAFSPSFADPESLLLNPVDSSSSCSPSSSVFNNLDPNQVHYYLPQNSTLSSLLNVVPNNPLEHGFDLGCDIGFLDTQASSGSSLMNRGGGVLTGFSGLSSNNQMNAQDLCSNLQFSTTRLPQLLENSSNFSGFRGFEDTSANALFPNRPKLLRPLDSVPDVGAPPTLFRKEFRRT